MTNSRKVTKEEALGLTGKLKGLAAKHKSYLKFSLVAGVLGFAVSMLLAFLGEEGMYILGLFVVAPLLISVLTVRRYSELKKLLGPLAVFSLLYGAIGSVAAAISTVAYGSFFGLAFPYNYVVSALYVIFGPPVLGALMTAVLFIPSAFFFAVATVVLQMFGRKPKK